MGRTLLGGSKSTSTPKDVTPPDVEALRGQFTNTLGGLITSPPQYSGPLSAGPPNPAENQFLSQLQSVGGGQGSNLIGQTLAGNFLPGQPGANPFLDAAIRSAQQPTAQALQDTLSRTLPGVFTAAGHYTSGGLASPNPVQRPGSTAFDLAASRAFEGGARSLGDIATNISNQQYQQERTNQQGAIGLGQSEVQRIVDNLTAQALPRNIQQAGVEKGIEQYNKDIQSLLTALATATQTPLTNIGNQQNSSSTGGLLPGLAGLFAGRATGTAPA